MEEKDLCNQAGFHGWCHDSVGFAFLRRELLKVWGYFQHQNVFNFDFYLRQEIQPGRFEFYTPEDEQLEPENTPLEEESHLPKHHFQFLC